MGMGPVSLSFGDEIYVLLGGTVPFVLCPLDNQTDRFISREDPNVLYHSLIGCCYRHGIMDGEAAFLEEPRTVFLR